MQTDMMRIEGSHGALLVHRPTGHVVRMLETCSCGECGGGYHDVMMFDPVDLAREADLGDVMDIVYIGYWDRAGVYEAANSNRMDHGPHGVDFDAAMPMSFLPSPMPMAA
jgi:hypothetical protein